MRKKRKTKVPKAKESKAQRELVTLLEAQKQRALELADKLKAITDAKGQLSMVETPFAQNQLLRILQKTPAIHVHQRPAKGGGMWDYVEACYMEKVLNYITGWMWSFEIKRQWESHNQVLTHGRLEIYDGNRNLLIFKEQNGRAEIKLKKADKTPLDIGNDYKASATDSFKKCTSKLGIASDIYGRNEFRDVDPKFQQPKDITPTAPIIETIDLEIKQKVAMIRNQKLLTKEQLDGMLEIKDRDELLSKLVDVLDNQKEAGK